MLTPYEVIRHLTWTQWARNPVNHSQVPCLPWPCSFAKKSVFHSTHSIPSLPLSCPGWTQAPSLSLMFLIKCMHLMWRYVYGGGGVQRESICEVYLWAVVKQNRVVQATPWVLTKATMLPGHCDNAFNPSACPTYIFAVAAQTLWVIYILNEALVSGQPPRWNFSFHIWKWGVLQCQQQKQKTFQVNFKIQAGSDHLSSFLPQAFGKENVSVWVQAKQEFQTCQMPEFRCLEGVALGCLTPEMLLQPCSLSSAHSPWLLSIHSSVWFHLSSSETMSSERTETTAHTVPGTQEERKKMNMRSVCIYELVPTDC